jgi:hypothetical protein
VRAFVEAVGDEIEGLSETVRGTSVDASSVISDGREGV